MFLIVEVFDYVCLLNCAITEHSIAFDRQNVFVSSIKFDWVRLPNVRLTTSGFQNRCQNRDFLLSRSHLLGLQPCDGAAMLWVNTMEFFLK